MPTITIPKEAIKDQNLVAVPRDVYQDFLIWREQFAELKDYRKSYRKIRHDVHDVTEDMVLRWSREAKSLKRRGKLPILKSLKDLR